MNILIVIISLEAGGAEKQVIVDANSFIKKGHRVTIALHREGELCNLLDKKVAIYELKSENEILASLQLFYHLLLNKYDVIHAHMFWAEKVAAISGKFTSHKIVFNEHGLGLWRKWYHVWIMKFIAKFADKIINSCDATRKIRFEKEKIKKDKLLTIYNSFEPHNGILSTGSQLSPKKPNEFIIGYVGRFNPVKRLNLFVDLAERLKNRISAFKIILVGDGAEKENVQKEIEKKNLHNYFLLPGFILTPQKYFNLFDIFLLPSKREAFSVALLEAGAAGIPSIAFDVGGNAELIKNNYTGYIIPDCDVDLLLERIISLYQNPTKRLGMGNAAVENIKANFSTEIRVQKLESLYQELC